MFPILSPLWFVLAAGFLAGSLFHPPGAPVMVYLLALGIFVGLSAACWFVSAALCYSTTGDPAPSASPDHAGTAAAAVGLAALTSFAPFLVGYAAGLVVWAVAAFGGLGLTTGRAAVLFAYLALTSLLARFVVLGVLGAIGG